MQLGVYENLSYFAPEIVLTVSVAATILVDLTKQPPGSRTISRVATAGFGAALVMLIMTYIELVMNQRTRVFLFADTMVVDPFALFFKTVACACAFLVSMFASRVRRIEAHGEGEFFTLLGVTTLGIFLMASSIDMVAMVVAIETLSIPSYILAGYFKKDRASSEASLKYVLFGATATGAMLFGLSYFYGLAGTTSFAGVGEAIRLGRLDGMSAGVMIGMVLVGFGFKISAAPFHMWTPDVYEGSPTPVTAYLSTASKAGGLAVLIRFFYNTMARPESSGDPAGPWVPMGDPSWAMFMAVIAVLTMTIGNLAAYRQTNVKRLLAYSSIAHAGYMLLGFVVMHGSGLMAILFYLAVYVFMNLGAFLAVIAVTEAGGGEELSDFRGLGWRAPFLSLCMAAFLFSLTGLPPFSGFVGKVYLFAALVQNGWIWLAVIAALNSAVSLYYYVRIVKAMYLDGIPRNDGDVIPLKVGVQNHLLLATCLVPTLLFGLYWVPLEKFARFSLGAWFGK